MAQRFAWLEEMLELLRPQMPQLLANRERAADRQYAGQVKKTGAGRG